MLLCCVQGKSVLPFSPSRCDSLKKLQLDVKAVIHTLTSDTVEVHFYHVPYLILHH